MTWWTLVVVQSLLLSSQWFYDFSWCWRDGQWVAFFSFHHFILPMVCRSYKTFRQIKHWNQELQLPRFTVFQRQFLHFCNSVGVIVRECFEFKTWIVTTTIALCIYCLTIRVCAMMWCESIRTPCVSYSSRSRLDGKDHGRATQRTWGKWQNIQILPKAWPSLLQGLSKVFTILIKYQNFSNLGVSAIEATFDVMCAQHSCSIWCFAPANHLRSNFSYLSFSSCFATALQ